MSVESAYQRCEAITRREARNFYYGIRLLPPAKRRAMSALYAAARRIDDIGDGPQPAPAKLDALAEVRKQLGGVAAGDPPPDDAVWVALADAVRLFDLPTGALEEIVDGCEMDVAGTSYRTFEELVAYCRRVAGSVGRLSLAVYGCADRYRAGAGGAEAMADSLGVALQITNILRDITEDRELMGRIYLPSEDIERFGARADLTGPADAVAALVTFEAARAEDWYERGLRLLPLLDRRSRACTAAMAGIYRQLLVRIQRDPSGALDRRISLPASRKALVAARALAMGQA
jgi:phytoene synthase